MGAVYRVHSGMGGRVEAALKVLKPSGETHARALFIREVLTGARAFDAEPGTAPAEAARSEREEPTVRVPDPAPRAR